MKYKLKERKGRNVQIMWEGTDKWLSTGCSTRFEAKQWADEQAKTKKEKGITFGEYSRNFFMRKDKGSYRSIDILNGRQLTEKSYLTFQSELNCYLLGYFNKVEIIKITPVMIDDWKAWIKKRKSNTGKPYANSTINKGLGTLKRILDKAVYDGIIQYNPVNAVKKMRPEAHEKQIYTQEELYLLFNGTLEDISKRFESRTFAMIFYVLYKTGLRPNEAVALQRKNHFYDISGLFATDVIDVVTKQPRKGTKTSQKGKKYRVSVLDKETNEMLKEYIDSLPPKQEFLFLYPNGGHINTANVTYFLKKACKNIGIPYKSPYALRHNFMTRVSANYNDDTVKELMGWTGWQSCYDHRTPETIIKKAKAMIEENN